MVKDEIQSRLKKALEVHGLGGILLCGVDNLTYAAGVVFPYAHQYPDRVVALLQFASGAQSLLCPAEWAQAVQDQNWDGEIMAYPENSPDTFVMAARQIAAKWVEKSGTGLRIGVDMQQIPYALLNTLKHEPGNIEWLSCDSWISDLRSVKTASEIALLEEAALIADRGFIGALNHLEGTVGSLEYTMAELAERVRVHAYEFDSSGVGYLCAVQGTDGRDIYAPATDRLVEPGNLIRMDYSHHFNGYWNQAGRMVSAGMPNSAQLKSYQENIELKKAAVAVLNPGVSAASVFDAVVQASAQKGILFWGEAGVGHGVGVSEAEAPFLTRDNADLLKEGMVIALNIWTYGPQGELIHSVDTYEITSQGNRLMSWYKNWDQLYAVTGFRATH